MPVVREARRQNKPNNPHCAVPIKDPLLDRMNSVQKAAFIERYGVYSENHPLTKFVRSLPIAKANPDIDIYVTKRLNEPNALSFPDGTVFITDRMFNFCKYIEEIEFILAHEITHINERHSEKMSSENEILSQLGKSRIHEYEADLALLLKERKNALINPFGGIVFLERMAEYESMKKLQPDLTHGSTYDRLMNVEYATRVIDLDALASTLSKLPQSITGKSRSGYDYWKTFQDLKKKSFKSLLRAATNIDLKGAAMFWSKVYISEIDPDKKEEILIELSKNIINHLKKAFPDSCEEVKKCFTAFLIRTGFYYDSRSTQLCDLSTDLKQRMVSSPEFHSGFIKMLESLPKDFPIRFDETNLDHIFATAINALAKESPDEAGFAKAKRMCQVFLSIGNIEKPNSLDIKLALFLLKLYSKKRIPHYLDRLKSEGIDIETDRLLGIICRQFKLSKKEAEKLELLLLCKAQESRHTRGSALETYRSRKAIDQKLDEEIQQNLHLPHNQEMNVTNKEDARSVAKSIVENIRTYDELISLMKSGNGIADPSQKNAFYIVLDYFPDVFLDEAKKALGIDDFTNRQAIEIFKNSVGAIHTSFSILIWGRQFTNSQLKELKECFTIRSRAIMSRGNDQSMYSRLLIRHLERKNDRESFMELTDFIYKNKLLENLDMIQDEAIDVFTYSLQTYSFDLGSKKDCEDLLTLSCFLPDPNLRLRLQKSIVSRYCKLLDQEGQYKLLFHDGRLSDYSAAEARERYINDAVSRPEKLKQINDYVLERIESISGKKTAIAIISERVTDELVMDKKRLFKALLISKRSGSELRSCLLDVHFRLLEEMRCNNASRLEFIDKMSMLIPPFETEELLYNLDHEGRVVLVNKLLLGKDGVLVDKKSRKELMSWFFDNFISKPANESEKTVYNFLELAFSKVAEKADVSTLYFLIAPMVIERILGRPESQVDWVGLFFKKVQKLESRSNPKDREDEKSFPEFVVENTGEILEYIESGRLPHIPIHEGTAYIKEEDYADIFTTIIDDERQYAEISKNKAADRLIEATKLCSRYIRNVPETVHEMGSIDFVKRLSSNMGAPGVRFLQSLGIYVDLPPGLRREFDDVYDNVKGQLKLSAYHTLEKNWNGGTKLDQELECFGPRVGGGSLVTVYEAQVKGEQKVLKVVNPNVKYRAERICDNLCDIFSSDERLARGVPLIENIRTWIAEDVSFESADLAQTFSDQNNGFSVPDNEYSIWVPDVHKQEKKFVVEDFVQGKNLTDWEELAKTHEMKQVVSLVVKNALNQLSKGVVHADIHVGNIRVTDDKQVALLDKNYLLVLSEHDRSFLASLTIFGRNKPALAKAIGEYLCSFEENKDVNQDQFIKELTDILVANGHRDVGSLISDCVSIISKQNGIIPLNVMLLVKNALALERMAKRAGFENILDAFNH
jgi:predicted unusual protein kinase regulating ubiquinone biosynthesis (AarF/ABC1/UbiB family)